MKTFKNQAAQGDLFIRRIDSIPDNAKPLKSEKGQFIVAHSETGHNHVIAERPNVKMFATDDPMVSYLQVVEATEATENCLKKASESNLREQLYDQVAQTIPRDAVILEHLRSFDTHAPIVIPPGNYEVRRQREYTPEGWRRVED